MQPPRLFAALFFACCAAQGAVTLPELFSDHMVIERRLPVHIWGTASPNEPVSASFRGENGSTTADANGRFSLYLAPGEAGGPFELAVKGSNQITLHDVLVGDVWVASGQSNMEFGLKNVDNSAKEIAGANYPTIRLLTVARKSSEYPLESLPGAKWEVCTPETAKNFSAVAYFFARDIQQKHNVPIGLIHSSWGGTPAEAWTSARTLGSDAALMPVYSEWAKMMQAQPAALKRYEEQLSKWQTAVAQAKAAGKEAPGRPYAPNQDYSWRPSGLFNGMIAPLTPFPIRGAIWYQGESNTSPERAGVYRRLFEAMITDWRREWGVGNFPFLFVQLANFKTGPNSQWPVVREAQLQTLELANTGMAVTVDIGNPTDIHPKNKQDVGHRLALAGRAVAYGEQLEYSGPLFRQAAPQGNAMRVWFDHAEGLKSQNGELRGFEVAGADHHFVPAEARVEGASVVVSAASVGSPVEVRYGWSDNPEANLTNAQALPASPFRSAAQ